MFFVGIFGIDQAQKNIGTYNNTICPSCGALSRFEVIKAYSYFHIFFIPTFRWNVRYYVKTTCCKSIYGLDAHIGIHYENGSAPEITNEHLRPLTHHQASDTCSGCGARIEPGYSFCPYCGRKRT